MKTKSLRQHFIPATPSEEVSPGRGPATAFRSAAIFLAIVLGGWHSPVQAGFTNDPRTTITGVYDSAAAWCDYDNDGRLDFIVIGLTDYEVPTSRIYRNQGDGTFTNSGIVLPAVYRGAVAWGDYDNDGNVDLLLAGDTSFDYPFAPICRLYRNQGNGTFAETGLALPGVDSGAVAWGDYDGDGRLDFIITGWGDSDRITRIYHNNGNGTFSESGIALIAVADSAVAWGDYDNDGDLDLLLSGNATSGRTTLLYRNNSNGTFSESGIPLPGLTTASAAFGDYDNDGDLDLFLSGSTGATRISQVYSNSGGGTLTLSANLLTGVSSGTAAWGDYNNDGNPDLLVTGVSDSGPVTLLYTNQGHGLLSESGLLLPGVGSGSAAWGDYDHSGQLDLLLTGFSANYSGATYLLRNTETQSNAPPAVITGLNARLSGRDITLSWNSGSDDHTATRGLLYNLRLGMAPGGQDTLAPGADPVTGSRRVVQMGNAGQTNSWIIKNVPDGIYYWSVQAIDTSFAGGPFAAENSFRVPTNAPTDIALNPAAVLEEQPAGTTVGTLSAADMDVGETHVFALVAGSGDSDNASFTITNNQLKTAAIFEYETRTLYQVRVRATDSQLLTFEKALTVAILKVNKAPVARCTNVTVIASFDGTAPASINNGSSDPDGDTLTISQTPPGPYFFGTNAVVLTVTDPYGASNACAATVRVIDRTAPAITCPADIVLVAGAGQCQATAIFTATAIDNLDPSPVVTCVPDSGSSFPVGRTIVICTVRDASGNTNACSFNVWVYPPGSQSPAGGIWTAHANNARWRCIASSASGTNLVAAVEGGQLYTSSDMGITWTARETNRNWSSVASSSDGDKLVAAEKGGRIYTSTDFGATWTPRESIRSWSSVASSADGTKLIAVEGWLAMGAAGYIYTSTDSGATWTVRYYSPRYWSSVASSADGGTLLATEYYNSGNGGLLFISTNSGATWTAGGANHYWLSAAISADGTKLVAADGYGTGSGGLIYTSSDWGSTWTARATNRFWSSIESSSDGTKLIASASSIDLGSPGQIYTSTDSGVTWTPRESNRYWSAVASSDDGNFLVAADYYGTGTGGRIYSSHSTPLPPSTPPTIIGAADRMVEAGPSSNAVVTFSLTATNTCQPAFQVTCSPASGTTFSTGTNPVTCTAVDAFGASNTTSFNVIVLPPTQPIITCPPDVEAAALPGTCQATVTYSVTATDNLDNSPVVTCMPSSGSSFPVGSTPVFCTARDAAGNTSTCSFPVVVYPAGTLSGETWTARDTNRTWWTVASSADGTKLITAGETIQIYTSTDSGVTWTPRESNRYWHAVASSADGAKLVAAASPGQIYTSIDSGVTWTSRENSRYWEGVASSADGTKLIAVAYLGQIYTSTNSGMTWTPRETNRNWHSVASSADGTKLVAVGQSTQIYTSTDSGVTWMAREAQRNWSSIASSADGTKLVATASGGQIYMSIDSGVTWTAREAQRNWSSIASSADGTKLSAVVYGGRIYTSHNSGITWLERETSRAWMSVASSADGNKLVSAVAGGQIYTSAATNPSLPTILGATSRAAIATSPAGAVVNFTVTATNTCMGTVPVVCTPPSGSTFPIGVTIVTCVATDALGSTSTTNFTVTVLERPEKIAWGESITLNGTNNYGTVPNFYITNTPMTIELWAKRDSFGTWDALVGQGAASSGKGLFFSFVNDDRVVFSFYNGGLYTTNTYTDSGWHHWAAVYDPALGRRIYRDGVLVASDSNTGAYTGNGSLFIGLIPWDPSGTPFQGQLDDVRIWNVARTGSEIWSDMLHPVKASSTGLVGYWKFDAESGSTIRDATVYAHHGVLVNPERRSSTVPPWGYSLGFDGPGTVQIPSLGWSMPTNEVTVEVWLRIVTNRNTWPCIVHTVPDDNANRLSVNVGVRGTPNFYYDFGNGWGSGRLSYNSGLAVGPWQHLAVVASQSGNYMAVYTNGVRESIKSGFDPFERGNYFLELAFGFVGELDEFRIWNKARSQGEIQSTLAVPLTGSESNLVACWNFDEGAGDFICDSSPHALDGFRTNQPPWLASTVGQAPTVATLAAGDLPTTGSNVSATLNGSVTPNRAPVKAWFEWGTTTNYGSRTPGISVESGLTKVACSNFLAGLISGQIYHYRFVAENCFGLVAGADQSFSCLLVTFNGDNPLTNRAGTALVDPGISTINPGGLALGASAIAAGNFHALALRSNGTIVGWGTNDFGQISIPGNATNIARIAAGGNHSLAVNTNGTVFAWGSNPYYESVVPTAATNVAVVSAGYQHSLALRRDGAVVGWGNVSQALVPADATNIAAIAAGGYHSVAARSNGTVLAWGLNNSEGQTLFPPTATNVQALSAGHGHTLALRGNGTVVSWGNNLRGQTNVPPEATNIMAVAASGWHSLALRTNGTVIAWGAGSTNLGAGLDFGQSIVPAAATNVVAIAAGIFNSYALKADGSVIAWGHNAFGQVDGVTITVTDLVNTNVTGLYTITYAVTNVFGVGSTNIRIVRIVDIPAPITQAPTNISSGSVALRSAVNPNGLDTLGWFRFGTTTNYGSLSGVTNLGNGFMNVSCALQVMGLAPETTYHYQAVASNSIGAVYGGDAAFTTLSANCSLAGLSLAGLGVGQLILTPEFDSATTFYTSTAPVEVGSVTVSPTAAHSGATIRVRVNGGAYSALVSGGTSGPLVVNVGTNVVDVQVTAQDGLATKTYQVNLIRAVPSAVVLGPYFPPLLGVTFSMSGVLGDDQIGRASGKTWYFSNAALAEQATVFWGPTNGGIKISFDDSVYAGNEILTYQSALSTLANGIAIWAGQTLTPPSPVRTVYTRFVLAVTNLATSSPIPLIEAASLGLATNIGAVIRVTPGLYWKAVLRFEASYYANGPFEPALQFFDREVASTTARAYSSFGAGFFHFNTGPLLQSNEPLTLNRGTTALISSALLAAADLESGPEQLRFQIAPGGQGGTTRNGVLRLNGVPLSAGDLFTQADIYFERLTYAHDGSCETNDDFTFNVTDQNGAATPRGDHSTYTFRIGIVMTNVPVVAFNGSAATGLQAPYHGYLPATNGDCTPQTLTFRLLNPSPTNGTLVLDNSNTGAFTYTPAAGKQGSDSFQFQVNDGFGDAPYPGTFTITVSNQRPTAIAASWATRENMPFTGTLTASDLDQPPQSLTFAIITNPGKGTLVLTNAITGGFAYTPNPGAIGLDQYTFTAGDGTLQSEPGTVTINIRPDLEEGDLLVSAGSQIVLIDGTGAQAVISAGRLLTEPHGLAFQPGGTILVVDSQNGLLRIDPANDLQTVVSAGTNFSSKPLGAWGIALETGGTLLVADGLNGIVRVNPSSGAPSVLSAGNQLLLPFSVALAAGGDIFVGDAAGMSGESGITSRIVRVNTTTGAQSLLSAGGQLFLPSGIAVESSGRLLVTDASSLAGAPDLLLRVDQNTGNQVVLTASNLLATPTGVAVGSSGTIYVVNLMSENVVAVNPVTGAQSVFSSGSLLAGAKGIAMVSSPAPNLLVGIQVASGQVSLQFLGVANRSYTLERSLNLSSWSQVTNSTAALDGLANFIDRNPPSGRAFYRVRFP